MKRERGKGWQGMAQIKQCTKRQEGWTEGGMERGRKVGWSLHPVIALMYDLIVTLRVWFHGPAGEEVTHYIVTNVV